MLPLYCAKRTEKEVSRLSAGFLSYTVRNTCESVIISLGGRARAASMASILSVVQLITRHLRSSSSRMVCTCGRMSRPLGAWMSCGMTSMTVSFSSTSRPTMPCDMVSSGNLFRRLRRMSSSPFPVRVLTNRGTCPHCCSMRRMVCSASDNRSHLFSIQITGTFFSFNKRCQCNSSSRCSSVQTIRAMSVFSSARCVCRMRSSPSSPSSSKPAVSMNTQGPRPWISMALKTGSVVVPGISDTRAVS